MPDTYDNVVERILEKIPVDIPFIHKDLSNHLKTTIRNWLQEMDLVTLEEFQIQEKVLEKTRAKVSFLEKTISDLEKRTR